MYLKYSTWPPWYDDTRSVGVFLQRGAHDILDARLWPGAHDFGALRLDQPALMLSPHRGRQTSLP
jgi:hypothetical protein